MISRRALAAGAAGFAIAGTGHMPAARAAVPQARLEAALAGLEAEAHCRLGVAVDDTHAGIRWGWRSGERFPMCSTFKLLAAGAVLARVDAGKDALDRRIVFQPADIVTYSPVTKARVGGAGMTLAAVCEAGLAHSDNTAGNLMLASVDGPAGVTAFARSLGDDMTRLDRSETALNEATPGDERDTTTPAAMAGNMAALLLGNRLRQASRWQLTQWLLDCRTGDAKLRAGLPNTWQVGDKTGGGDYGTTNDAAILWPPGRKPMIACVYLTESRASFDDRNAVIAAVGRLVAGSI